MGKVPRYAAIDVGSNSIRLLVAEVNDRRTKTLVSDRQVVRLGTGVFRDGTLVETSQWSVYRDAVARWPSVLTTADRRRMRAMILGDRSRESRRRADALAYCLRSLKEWPFNRRRLREAFDGRRQIAVVDGG